MDREVTFDMPCEGFGIPVKVIDLTEESGCNQGVARAFELLELGEERVLIVLKEEGDHLRALSLIAERRGVKLEVVSREGNKVALLLSKR